MISLMVACSFWLVSINLAAFIFFGNISCPCKHAPGGELIYMVAMVGGDMLPFSQLL